MEDIQDDEDFLQDLKKMLGMTVYRNRGYDIMEAEVRKGYNDNNDDNEMKNKSIPTIQQKNFKCKKSFYKNKIPDSNKILEQQEYLNSFRKWLIVEENNRVTSTQLKPSEHEKSDKENILPQKSVQDQISSNLIQLKPSEEENNDKEISDTQSVSGPRKVNIGDYGD